MGWLSSLFGGDEDTNPSNSAMQFLNQIPETYNPLKQQFQNLSSMPGERLNEIGGAYQQSPGFQHALQQALAASGHAAAAGGMAGTPAHQYDAMSAAQGLVSKDYNDWMTNALALHNTGLAGQTGIADQIAQVLAQQGAYSYQGQAGENQNRNALWNTLFKGLGGAGAGFLAGGPVGAAVGGIGGLASGFGSR